MFLHITQYTGNDDMFSARLFSVCSFEVAFHLFFYHLIVQIVTIVTSGCHSKQLEAQIHFDLNLQLISSHFTC